MHSLNLRLALFFAVVLGIAGLCVCSVNHQVKEALAGLLPKSLMERTGLISKRFSGIKVEGLSVNLVARAELRLKPVPVLAWNGGERRLDDLLK